MSEGGYVIIRCAERLLALPLAPVAEVFRMVAIATRLPRAPRHCLGLIDWHGRLVPAFDLPARLGLCAPRTDRELVDGHLVFIDDPVGPVAYAVDELRELSEESPEQLPGAGSAAVGHISVGAVRTREGKLAPLLDPTSLLTTLARHQLRAALEVLESRP